MLPLCYHYNLSLNWILSKAMILMLGQLIEYYIEEILEEKIGCLKTNFGLLHWQGDSLT